MPAQSTDVERERRARALAECVRCRLPARRERVVPADCGEAPLEIVSCGFHVFEHELERGEP